MRGDSTSIDSVLAWVTASRKRPSRRRCVLSCTRLWRGCAPSKSLEKRLLSHILLITKLKSLCFVRFHTCPRRRGVRLTTDDRNKQGICYEVPLRTHKTPTCFFRPMQVEIDGHPCFSPYLPPTAHDFSLSRESLSLDGGPRIPLR